MNKRLKKKANSYKKLTCKQRFKNQGKTIRQMRSEIDQLNHKYEVVVNSFYLAYDIVDRFDVRCKQQQYVIEQQKQQIERLQSPWWKKVLHG